MSYLTTTLEQKVRNQRSRLAHLEKLQRELIDVYVRGPHDALHEIVKLGKRAQPLTVAAHMAKVAENALSEATNLYEKYGHWPGDWQ